MTLGNMPANGARTLAAWCLGRGCNHFRALDVSDYPDDLPVPSFGPRLLVLTVLSYALHRFLGRSFVRSGIELVWLAEPAHSEDGCPALLDSNEPTISAAAALTTVNSTPLIGVSGGRSDSKERRCRARSSNGEAK